MLVCCVGGVLCVGWVVCCVLVVGVLVCRCVGGSAQLVMPSQVGDWVVCWWVVCCVLCAYGWLVGV